MLSPISASTSHAPVPHGVEHGDRPVIGAELRQVLVRRTDDDVHTGARRDAGQAGDDVVRLEARDLELGQAERFDHAPHHRQLIGQLRRHRRPVRLVVRVELAPEVITPARVVDDAQVGRLLLPLDAQDHLAEAIDRAGLRPLRRLQRRQRVKRPEQEVEGVDDVEAGLGARRSVGAGHRANHRRGSYSTRGRAIAQPSWSVPRGVRSVR
jgi:hypothetical protein